MNEDQVNIIRQYEQDILQDSLLYGPIISYRLTVWPGFCDRY